MEWLYDDAFYYMITARHLSEQHLSSFDGITVTSGYHPLWMWLCSIVYGWHGRLDLTYVRSCMVLSLLITSLVLFAALYGAVVKRQRGALWALTLGATSYSALNNGLTVMEWPLVILCWYLLHQLLTNADGDRGGSFRASCFAAFLVGVAGSLSRTDFGLIPVCYVIGAVSIALRAQNWTVVRRAAWATLGAVAGLGLVLIYNHRMTGSWVQMSAEVKHLSASMAIPFNPVPALWQFLRVLLYLPALDMISMTKTELLHTGLEVLLVAGLLILLVGVMQRKVLAAVTTRIWKHRGEAELGFLVSAGCAVTGYAIVYGFNSQATYGWYSATVTGFVLLLAAASFRSLDSKIAATIALSILAWNIVASEYFGGNAKTQTQEILIGKRLHAEHPQSRMGGGDVGKASFYNDGTMINLDGLMNNEVFPYLVSGHIHCYLLLRHIEYTNGIGTISVPLTDSVRRTKNLPALPWSKYFVPVDGRIDAFLATDFNAIRSSGECPNIEK